MSKELLNITENEYFKQLDNLPEAYVSALKFADFDQNKTLKFIKLFYCYREKVIIDGLVDFFKFDTLDISFVDFLNHISKFDKLFKEQKEHYFIPTNTYATYTTINCALYYNGELSGTQIDELSREISCYLQERIYLVYEIKIELRYDGEKEDDNANNNNNGDNPSDNNSDHNNDNSSPLKPKEKTGIIRKMKNGIVSKLSSNKKENARYLLTPENINVFEAQKRATRAGYSPELISPGIQPKVKASVKNSNVAPATFNNLSVETSGDESFLFNEPYHELIENIRTDEYETIEPATFHSVSTTPLSTFKSTCSKASVATILNNYKNNSNIHYSMVRTEEVLNFLQYSLNTPQENEFFKPTFEKTSIPNSKNELLFVGIKGKSIIPKKKTLTILLDVSGSMYSNVSVMKMILAGILNYADKDTILNLVTYSDSDATLLNGFKYNPEEYQSEIYDAIASIRIAGCTYGSAGINKAYELAKKHFVKDGTNRVILITDGDLNFGITNKDGLKGLIEQHRKENIFLTVVGTGLYNYKDDKLETLSKNGHGYYCGINMPFDAKYHLIDNKEQFFNSIATDVKFQIEFNPKYVEKYKLIGYENRTISAEDFRNDDIIAEPFASSSYAVALYEIVPTKDVVDLSTLKYQKSTLIDSDEIGNLSIRYKEINKEEVDEINFIIDSKLNKTENIEKALECYEICEKLRDPKTEQDKKQEAIKDLIRML